MPTVFTLRRPPSVELDLVSSGERALIRAYSLALMPTMWVGIELSRAVLLTEEVSGAASLCS